MESLSRGAPLSPFRSPVLFRRRTKCSTPPRHAHTRAHTNSSQPPSRSPYVDRADTRVGRHTWTGQTPGRDKSTEERTRDSSHSDGRGGVSTPPCSPTPTGGGVRPTTVGGALRGRDSSSRAPLSSPSGTTGGVPGLLFTRPAQGLGRTHSESHRLHRKLSPGPGVEPGVTLSTGPVPGPRPRPIPVPTGRKWPDTRNDSYGWASTPTKTPTTGTSHHLCVHFPPPPVPKEVT